MISELTGVRTGHSDQTLSLTLRLKTDKCCLCLGGPMEGLKGGCQAGKRSHYLAVVPNEATEKVCEAQELLEHFSCHNMHLHWMQRLLLLLSD